MDRTTSNQPRLTDEEKCKGVFNPQVPPLYHVRDLLLLPDGKYRIKDARVIDNTRVMTAMTNVYDTKKSVYLVLWPAEYLTRYIQGMSMQNTCGDTFYIITHMYEIEFKMDRQTRRNFAIKDEITSDE
jgi:hypothetical protein